MFQAYIASHPVPALSKAHFKIYVKMKYLQSILLTYFPFLIDYVLFFSTAGKNSSAYVVLHVVTTCVMSRVVW
jgi:hypothetical protein